MGVVGARVGGLSIGLKIAPHLNKVLLSDWGKQFTELSVPADITDVIEYRSEPFEFHLELKKAAAGSGHLWFIHPTRLSYLDSCVCVHWKFATPTCTYP